MNSRADNFGSHFILKLSLATALTIASLVFGPHPHASGKELSADLDRMTYSLHSGLLVNLIAKEACSCLFIAKLSEADCLARAGLSEKILSLVALRTDEEAQSVAVSASLLGSIPFIGGSPIATAHLRRENPRLGCRLD